MRCAGKCAPHRRHGRRASATQSPYPPEWQPVADAIGKRDDDRRHALLADQPIKPFRQVLTKADHRTGTAGDKAGALWLAREAAGLGVEVTTETFGLDR